MTFSIIYADPPWSFKCWSDRNSTSRSGSRAPSYSCLSLERLSALPVASIAAPDATLCLWATYPLLPEALRVMAAWGFQYKTVGFTWVKDNPSGIGYHCGLGYWTRGNPEICLLGTRGHPKRVSKAVRNLVCAPRGRHSAKPPEVRSRIVELLGDLPRVELFARPPVPPGWVALGNEIDGLDIREALLRVKEGA